MSEETEEERAERIVRQYFEHLRTAWPRAMIPLADEIVARSYTAVAPTKEGE